jgi:hypothetical protein
MPNPSKGFTPLWKPAIAAGPLVLLASLLAAAAPATGLLPGEWEISTVMAVKAMPGASPMVAEMMAKAGARPQVQRRCLTAADLGPRPESAFVGPNCKPDKVRIGGGTYDIKAICTDPDGGTGTMETKGSYTPATFDQVSNIKRVSGPGGNTMLAFNTSGRRLGKCA